MNNKDNFNFGLPMGLGGHFNIIPVFDENIDANETDLDQKDLPEVMPLIPLRNNVLFPDSILPIGIGREKTIAAVKAVGENGGFLAVVAQNDPAVEDPQQADLFRYGVSGKVVKIIDLGEDNLTILLRGYNRFALKRIVSTEPYLVGEVEYCHDDMVAPRTPEIKIIIDSIK